MIPDKALPVNSLPVFRGAPECENCRLCSNAKNVGIPTRAYKTGTATGTAVLLLAKGPSIVEDDQGKHFAGPTAPYLALYLDWSGISKYADCYVTNAVRCGPVPKGTISEGALNACREHLDRDVRELQSKYDRVILLACGNEAGKICTGKGLGHVLENQGLPEDTWGCPVFGTYNPAILFPKRDSTKARAPELHLRLLRKYLELGDLPMKLQALAVESGGTPTIAPDDDVISLDIETYGAVAEWAEGVPAPIQTTFKSQFTEKLNGVLPHQTIVTVAISWLEDGDYRSYVWNLLDPRERTQCFQTMEQMRGKRWWLTGSNLPFDMSWMRAYHERWRELFTEENFRLLEMAVLNFMDDEERTERGLKSLSTLFFVFRYNKEELLKKGHRYRDAWDPQLHTYNVMDTLAALLIKDILIERVEERYAESGVSKLKALEWYSELVWMIIDLHETGIAYDRDKLEQARDLFGRRMERVAGLLEQRDIRAGGKDSVRSLQEFAQRVSTNTGYPLALTPVTGDISVTKDWLLGAEERSRVGSDTWKELRGLRYYRWLKKRLTSYAIPLLETQTLEHEHGTVIGYPSWFPVPMGDRGTGGTRQTRLASKAPSSQTQPPPIQACVSSRFGPDGVVVGCDESQLEYRGAAWLSRDPVMTDVFVSGKDLHLTTSVALCDALGVTWDVSWRHVGKTVNFLILFRGTAKKMQETIIGMKGQFIELKQAQRLIDAVYHQYQEFKLWQDSLIEEVTGRGWLQLPVMPYSSRSFIGGQNVVEANTPTICNMKVQTFAAAITLDAQMYVRRELKSRGLRTAFFNNIHDAGYYDIPREELPEVIPLIRDGFTRPPIVDHIIDTLQWEVPLAVEIKPCGTSFSEDLSIYGAKLAA